MLDNKLANALGRAIALALLTAATSRSTRSTRTRLPSFTTGDIGARFVTAVATLPLTLRLNVSNITNEAYWMSTQYTGTPRTLSASAQIMF